MITGVIDSTVIIHLLRRKPEAQNWIAELNTDLCH